MPAYTYTVILEPDAEGGYVAFCPSPSPTPGRSHRKAPHGVTLLGSYIQL